MTLSAGFDPFSVFAEGGIDHVAGVRTDANCAFLFDPCVAPRALQVSAYSDAFASAPRRS